MVPRDKLLHIIAGIIIALLVLKVMSFLHTMPMIARIVSIAAVIVAGVIREVYNKKMAAFLTNTTCMPPFSVD